MELLQGGWVDVRDRNTVYVVRGTRVQRLRWSSSGSREDWYDLRLVGEQVKWGFSGRYALKLRSDDDRRLLPNVVEWSTASGNIAWTWMKRASPSAERPSDLEKLTALICISLKAMMSEKPNDDAARGEHGGEHGGRVVRGSRGRRESGGAWEYKVLLP
jgi:hypothetical protein